MIKVTSIWSFEFLGMTIDSKSFLTEFLYLNGSLLVEEIDVGEAKVRQVVSGLAKYCNPDELMVL